MWKKSLWQGILIFSLLQSICLAQADAPDQQPATGLSQEKDAADAAQVKKDEKPVSRYELLFTDNSYIYYMDIKTARWIDCPRTNGEKIVDVWVKVVDSGTGDVSNDDNYSYSSTYYLEHFYLRPSNKQVQFLSELEVTGRPNNAIDERPYSVSNWENLVPGSIEEEMYNKVMKKMEGLGSKNMGIHESVRDMVEEYLRISI